MVSSNLTVGDLLQGVRERSRLVPAADIVQLVLEGNDGGRLHEEDILAAVLKDGDVLCTSTGMSKRSSLDRAGSKRGAPPLRGSVGRSIAKKTAQLAVGAGSGSAWKDRGMEELEAEYAQVFGAKKRSRVRWVNR